MVGDATGDNGAAVGEASLFQRLTVIEKVVAIAGATALVAQTVLGIQTSRRTADIEQRLKEIEGKIALSAEDRARTQNTAAITKEVFGEIKEIQLVATSTLEDRGDRLMLASAYVETIPDPLVRDRFREAVRELNERALARYAALQVEQGGQLTPVQAKQKSLLEDTVFALDTRQSTDQRMARTEPTGSAPSDPSKVADWSNYDFDIFWCDGLGDLSLQSKGIAEKVVALRAADKDATGRWRVRAIPVLTNSRPGYRAKGYEVRASTADEFKLAELLATEATAMLAKNGHPGKFVVRGSSSVTPWYISAFICPET